MEGKQRDQKVLPMKGSGKQGRHRGGAWAPALGVSGSCWCEATCLPLMGLALPSVNLGAKGAGQTLFSLASLLMTGIYCRPTVSHKSEVRADTLNTLSSIPLTVPLHPTFRSLTMLSV